MASVTPELGETFRSGFGGSALMEGDAGYEEARRIHNGLVDKRPALIARCTDTSDIAAAIRLGRENGLELSVRGGGHNVAGRAVTDSGVMIDLSLMKQVDVDADGGTITVGGGVTWGELNQAAHRFGLATTGGVVSSTGVTGLTLGGGVGWLLGKYGLAIDNLVSAQVVLASGEVVTASENDEPDLFWALRGGGGNFGVVSRLRFRVHHQPTVLGGALVHPLAAAPEAFGFYRDFSASLPDDLTAFAALRHAPDGSGTKLCGLPVCHAGNDEAQAEAEVAPLRRFGPPVADLVARIPYPVINTSLDESFPKGTLNYWKSCFLTELGDETVAVLVEAFENAPTTSCFLVIEHFHGAATRVPATATAFPHRRTGYNCIIISQWTDPGQSAAGIRWARATFDALRPHSSDAAYVNYLDADDAERVAAAYGPNYPRLVELKRRYDPENCFRLNQNIRPY